MSCGVRLQCGQQLLQRGEPPLQLPVLFLLFDNLLLLRGNIGRPDAGICPVHGNSNVQGQRIVGITEKPELVPLERLAEEYQF